MKPYNEAQRAILSIIINRGEEAFELAFKHINEKHFTEQRYVAMWQCIVYLYENGDHKINETTVKHSMQVQRVKGTPAFELLSPTNGNHAKEYLDIVNFKASENITYINSYVDIILDKFKVEKTLAMAGQINASAVNGMTTYGQLQQIMNKFMPDLIEPDRKNAHTLVEVGDTLSSKIKSSDELNQDVIFTHIGRLDEKVFLTKGNQTVIGGDTGHGKTSLALQMAWNIAKQTKKLIDEDTGLPMRDLNGNPIFTNRSVLFFSLEMSEDEIFKKFCCLDNNISMQEFETGRTQSEQLSMVKATREKISKLAPNFRVDCNSFSMREIKNRCTTQASTKEGLDVVFFDYIQLIEEARMEAQNKREDAIYRAISRSIKRDIAMRLGCHTVPLSQLNVAFKDKQGHVDHRPTIDRLFGSSALKQDATHVLFVYREYSVGIPYTEIKGLPDKKNSTYYVNRVILAKHRFGDLQEEIVFGFIPHVSQFVPLPFMIERGLLKDPVDKAYKFKEGEITLC